MVTHDYGYDTCLRGSVGHRPGRWTTASRAGTSTSGGPFLPERIAGVAPIGCLADGEKRLLNQIRGNSYCHIFAFVEEYIVPLVIDRARADVFGDETRLWSGCASPRRRSSTRRCCAGRSTSSRPASACSAASSPGTRRSPGVVLDATPLTALLLTSMIEWFTQLHYTEHVHRARRTRRAVPGHPPLPLDRRVTSRPHRQPAHRGGRRGPDQRRPGGGDRPAARPGRRRRRAPRPSRSTSTSTRSPAGRRPHVRRRQTQQCRRPTSGKASAGPSWSRGSNTRTSSASSSSSRPPAPPRSPPPHGRSPPRGGEQPCPSSTAPPPSPA